MAKRAYGANGSASNSNSGSSDCEVRVRLTKEEREALQARKWYAEAINQGIVDDEALNDHMDRWGTAISDVCERILREATDQSDPNS